MTIVNLKVVLIVAAILVLAAVSGTADDFAVRSTPIDPAVFGEQIVIASH